MTKLLERAIHAARELSPEHQDDIARIVLQLAGGDQPSLTLTPQERDALERSKAAAARGDFATDEEVGKLWAKHGH